MKSFSLFSLIITTVLFSMGCEDTESPQQGNLTINFKLKYGQEPLAMFEPYTYPTGQKMIFSRFSFYMGNTELKNNSGFKPIEEISYHNLTISHTGLNSASKGYDYTISGIQPGDYTALKFSLGVPKYLNDKTPADFSNDQILSNQAEYWSGWKSYVFTKTEGQIDFDGDGITESGFALHTGANDALRTIELPANIKIEDGKTSQLTVVIDVKKGFGNNPVYDIEANPQIHSLSQTPFVKQLVDNLMTAFSIQ